MISKKLNEIFNCNSLFVKEINVPKLSNKNSIPKIIPNYVFEESKLNDVLIYLAGTYSDGLYLYGPQGCGKTSFINQIASRLNWSVEECTLCNKSDITELIGFNTIIDGQLRYVYGPLTRAMINGSILIVNEIDTVSAGDLTILNDVIEGRPLTILSNNGQKIYPHPCFRIIATANTNGQGDHTGQYIGTRLFNAAFLDRWRFMKFEYSKDDFEFAILKRSHKTIRDETIKLLVKFANVIRANFAEENNTELTISTSVSTRILLKILSIYASIEDLSMQRAISIAFLSRYSDSEQLYLNRMMSDIFGLDPYTEKMSQNILEKQDKLKEDNTKEKEEVVVKKTRRKTSK